MTEAISGGISGPHGIGQTHTEESKEEFLTRAKETFPSIPITSVRPSLFESLSQDVKEKLVPLLMQSKASAVISTKELMLSGVIGHMQAAMTGVGGLFAAINAPVGLLNTFLLIKNWKKLSPADKGMKSTEILANTLLTGAGVSLLFSKVPALSSLIGQGGAMTAMKTAFLLGPIGMGLLSILNLGMGAISTKKAIDLYRQEQAIAVKEVQTDLDEAVRSREVSRLSSARNFELAKALKSIMIGVGIGLGALVMAGVIAGTLATPIGWAAVGLILAGSVIAVAIIVVQTRKAKAKEREENENLVEKITADESFDINNLTALSPLLTNEVLNSSSWPGNPTLKELIEKKVLKDAT